MTQILTPRFSAAAAILLALLTSTPVRAQVPLNQTTTRTSRIALEYAALSLPEAPQAQEQSPPVAPPPAPASTSVPPVGPPSSQPAPPPPAPAAVETREEERVEAEHELQAEKKQRLLGIMPQFQTVIGGQGVPLTAGQKWRLASASAIDPFYIGYAFVIGGGYGELIDSHTGYHHGATGYLKRTGSNYADNIDGALIGNGLLPILLHQDPRYFRKGTGSFRSRFLHAAASTVVCRGDSGHEQPNISNVLGNFISGAISNAYYPADERGLSLTLENGLEVTAIGAVGGQLLEFGPDINRLLHRHRTAPAPAPTAAPPTP